MGGSADEALLVMLFHTIRRNIKNKFLNFLPAIAFSPTKCWCELDDKKLSYIFLHELIHYRQRDSRSYNFY